MKVQIFVYFYILFFQVMSLAADFSLDLNNVQSHIQTIDSLNRSNRQSCFKVEPQPILKENNCPSLLLRQIDESRESRNLNTIQSEQQKCLSQFEQSRLDLLNQKNFKFETAVALQKAFESSDLSRLGSYTHQVAKNCLQDKNNNQHIVISKFYYLTGRLNLISAQATQDLIRVNRLLNEEPIKCPNSFVLAEAATACEEEKKCSSSLNLSTVALQATKDLDLLDKTKKQLSEVKKNCSNDDICKKQKEALSSLITGLIKKNPWFLDDEYIQSNHLSPLRRFESFLHRNQKRLQSLNRDIEKAALCAHITDQKNCDIENIRSLVGQAPELVVKSGQELQSKGLNAQVQYQSCVDESSIRRDQKAKDARAVVGFAAETIVTTAVGIGIVRNSVRAAELVIPRLEKLLGAETLVNFIFIPENMQQFVNSCIENKTRPTQNSKPTSENVRQCQVKNFSLNEKAFEEGNCLVDASLAALSVLPIVETTGRIISVAKSSGYLKSGTNAFVKAESSALNLQRETDSLIPLKNRRVISSRVLSSTDSLQKGIVAKNSVQIKAIATTPSTIDIYQVKKADGRAANVFSSLDQLPNGTWVQTPKEFLIDSVTGAIDATSPAGKELFEKLALSKGGEAHFAFFDVGSLGTVNREFKAGEAAGDRYLQGVAQKIIEVGDGKITLARTGGDEFGLIINEKDPDKVKALLEKIQTAIKSDLSGDAKKIFFVEKTERAKQFKLALEKYLKDNPNISREEATALLKKSNQELRTEGYDQLADVQKPIYDIARTSVPDVSIGSTQIGRNDTFSKLAEKAEASAKLGKVKSVLQQGRSASKYGSDELPRHRPNPLYQSPILDPVQSESWSLLSKTTSAPTSLVGVSEIKISRQSEVIRFKDFTVADYVDELGRHSYKTEKYIIDPVSKEKIAVLTDLPTKGSTGLFDGTHPEGQNLVLQHVENSDDSVVAMAKVKSLRHLNYFESGTQAGDEILAAVAETIKANSRSTDLNVKLSGADFLISLNSASKAQLKERFDKIQQQLKTNPRVVAVIEKEVQALTKKLDALKGPGNQEAMKEIKQKIENVKNFNFDLQFQSVTKSELGSKLDVKTIQKKLDRKF